MAALKKPVIGIDCREVFVFVSPLDSNEET
jgi:hypothetical protein